MKPRPVSPLPLSLGAIAFTAALALVASAAAVAQPPGPPGRPGGSPGMVTFEVLAIDPQGWIVTARNLESGNEFSFRMPPELFRGRRFRAPANGAEVGTRISVVGEPAAPFNQVRIERPLAAGGRSESGLGGPGEDGRRDPDRFAVPEGPGKYGAREPSRDASKYSERPSPLGQRGGPGEETLYEVMEVDSANWTVTARGENGATLKLEIDPQAFVGYRFRASVGSLRAGEGFELLADDERPVTACCTVKERPRQ